MKYNLTALDESIKRSSISNIFETGHLSLEPWYGRLTSAVLGRVG